MGKRKKDPHAAALGRKGARARWKAVPKADRSAIMRRVAEARWRRPPPAP